MLFEKFGLDLAGFPDGFPRLPAIFLCGMFIKWMSKPAKSRSFKQVYGWPGKCLSGIPKISK